VSDTAVTTSLFYCSSPEKPIYTWLVKPVLFLSLIDVNVGCAGGAGGAVGAVGVAGSVGIAVDA